MWIALDDPSPCVRLGGAIPPACVNRIARLYAPGVLSEESR